MADTTETAPVHLPRVAITFCTQCRWMLRAAYFAQELLSTFGGSLGEVALIPATGGLFTVHLTYKPEGIDTQSQEVLIWDRKAEGGFPETKILKQRVRNHIEPSKDLGHSDKPANKVKSNEEGTEKGEVASSSVKTAAAEASAKADAPPADCADSLQLRQVNLLELEGGHMTRAPNEQAAFTFIIGWQHRNIQKSKVGKSQVDSLYRECQQACKALPWLCPLSPGHRNSQSQLCGRTRGQPDHGVCNQSGPYDDIDSSFSQLFAQQLALNGERRKQNVERFAKSYRNPSVSQQTLKWRSKRSKSGFS